MRLGHLDAAMVLFPMIDVEAPPTDYCLRMLPFFKFLIFAQCLLVIGGIVINDWWGALSLAIVCLMGYLCTTGQSGMSITSCLYYAVIAIMCGVFDLIRAIMYFQKSSYSPFSAKAPALVHVAHAVMVLSPVCEFLSGYLAWSFYKDCRSQLEAAPLLPRAGGGGAYERYNAPAPNRNTQTSQQATTRAFQGEGQRLGSA